MSKRFKLRLYVVGDAPNSIAARANLDALLADRPGCRATVEVIDLLEQPRRGLVDSVLVTPTVIRVSPPPMRRVIGNLHDRAVVVSALGLDDERE